MNFGKEQKHSGQSKFPVGHTDDEGYSVDASHRVGPWVAVCERHPVGWVAGGKDSGELHGIGINRSSKMRQKYTPEWERKKSQHLYTCFKDKMSLRPTQNSVGTSQSNLQQTSFCPWRLTFWRMADIVLGTARLANHQAVLKSLALC